MTGKRKCSRARSMLALMAAHLVLKIFIVHCLQTLIVYFTGLVCMITDILSTRLLTPVRQAKISI